MRRLFCGGGAVSAAVPLALLLAFSPSPAQAQEETTILDPLVVTATRTERPLSTVGSSLTVITAEDLENRQTTYVADILREVPGVAVSRAGGPGSKTDIRIRGGETNHTLVLIDGIEANNPAGDDAFDFGHLLTDDIERIEVLRGPQSVLYGSEAVGGVINIITKRGQDEPRFNGSIEGGSFRTGKANASISTAGERYNLHISGTYLRSDGISQAKYPRGNTDSDGYRNTTGSVKLSVTPTENLTIDFIGRATDYKHEFDSGYDLATGRLLESDGKTRGRKLYGRTQATIDLFDGDWQHRLGATFTHLTAKNYRDGGGSVKDTGKRLKFDYQSDISFRTAHLTAAEHTFTFGLEHEEQFAELEGGNIDEDISSKSVFGLYQIDLLDGLSLSAGLRQDFNNEFKNANTYRLTAAYNFATTGTSFHGSYGTAVKNPTMIDLYGFNSPNWEANPDLKPEKSRGWEVGISQDLLENRVSLGATYFRRNIKDLIVQDYVENTSFNVDRARSHGVELTANLRLFEGLTLNGSYTYNDAEDDDNEQLVRRPSHMASANINYRFLNDRANLNIGYIYNGKQYDVAGAGRTTLHSYSLVNLAGSYRITDNFEVFGRLENAFDENYEEIYSYNTAGRAAYAGLRIRF